MTDRDTIHAIAAELSRDHTFTERAELTIELLAIYDGAAGQDLAAMTDDELYAELSRRWKARESRSMTRVTAVEARHQLHMAASRLQTARDEIGRGYDKPDHVEFYAREVIAQLEALIEYVHGRGGGTSFLRDRNA